MSSGKGVGSLGVQALSRAYHAGTLGPVEVIEAVYDRIEARGADGVWNALVPRAEALARARALDPARRAEQPLWGIPFAVKDNLDVPGLPTTSGLPESAYVAHSTGPAVSRLLEAGAIVIGKTSLDQFAVGLVGIRTPGPSCSCVFDPDYIPGGSSAGSAVAVAAGLVSFALGNDAAGSGRVPAAFNNIVGVKPTPGLVSNRAVSGGGVVRSIETISVFALDVPDGMAVLRLIAGYDPDDAFSRPAANGVDLSIRSLPPEFRFGVPDAAHLEFFGDTAAQALFEAAIARLKSMGGTPVEVDFAPFAEAQRILYEGPWIAERTAWLEPVIERHREHLHPVTRQILESGNAWSAKDVFRAMHRLAQLRQQARQVFNGIEVMVVPTTPTIYTKAQVKADPVTLNSRLGIYTNFANLLGMCGVAVPNGFRPDGLPQGISFLALELQESRAASHAAAYQQSLGRAPGGPGLSSAT